MSNLYLSLIYTGDLKTFSFLRLGMNEFRLDHMYILYYVNVAHLIITGIFPVGSLIVLNYLVYSHLVERRRQAESLGRPKSYMIFHKKMFTLRIVYTDLTFAFHVSKASKHNLIIFNCKCGIK